MDVDRKQIARLHGEIRALHVRFTFVTAEYDAGHITLSEEAMLLSDIIYATGAVMDRVNALMAE
jgi:hypothetical protein